MSESGKGKHSGENNGMYGKFGKDNPNYGSKRSDETKAKMSKSLKGKPGLKGESNPMYGKHHTEETKQKICNARAQQVFSKESIDKRNASLKDVNVIIKRLYQEYKDTGGKLLWNDFRKQLSNNRKITGKYSLEGII